jgi:hypothetical protein
VIATVVCGCGGSVGVGCVDMQVRCIVIFALGHCALHLPVTILDAAHAVFHGLFEDAEQSYTSPPSCSIASNATMLTADKKRLQRRIEEPQCVLEFAALYSRNMLNSVQPNHGCHP